MEHTYLKTRKSEKGFTLVELAVVMIIIGLLIGGVLKGQELITNARVTSTASQLESMSAAVNGFLDAYNARPGDMGTAQARLPNCEDATFCFDGNGDSILNVPVGSVAEDAAANGEDPGEAALQEASNFFIHLARGNFITGVDGSAAEPESGVTHPTTPFGSSVFNVGDVGQGASTAGFLEARGADQDLNGRLYVTIVPGPLVAALADNGPLDAQSAARIDRKLDDGVPNSGSLFASVGADASCRTAASSAAYDEANNSSGCSIAFALR